jgi:Domain of unknown function (DUF5668)/Putative adhesin
VKINRGLVFWGAAFITAGVVALAIQAELIPGETAQEAWRLWPLVLIVIGVAVIAARTPFGTLAVLLAGIVAGGMAGTLAAGFPEGFDFGCGGQTTESESRDGTFESGASVTLDFNCGDLAVSTASGNAWSVEARHQGDRQPQIESSGSSLRVSAEGVSFPFNADARQEWDVVLPTDVEIDLSLESNAASATLDLADGDLPSFGIDANAGDLNLQLGGASVADLAIDANAGSISIEADASTSLGGSVEMNAGSLDLCVPDDVALSITIQTDNVSFSHNLDESGLTQDGDTWASGEGEADITLSVDGNAASFDLNPEGGCD